MNGEKFLARSTFDPIIASLEALLLEVQNLVASVDPLNDPQVIADIQTVADQLAEILTVAGISGDITTVAGESANIAIIADNITQIQSIVDELQAILAVAAELPAIQTVADDTVAVNTVAGSIAAVQEVADNMQAVIDAVQAAADAADARDDAQTWAEGDDPDVELLGGVHSAKTWAEISEQHTREGIRFLGTVADLDNLPPNPDDGDAYFYAETVGDNAIGYGVVWSEAEQDWSIFQMGATLVPGTMLPDQEAAPAAANQTTFGGFSASPEMSLVMINRIEQESDTFTFDGNQIVFSQGLKAGDIVRVRQWRTQVSFEDLPDVESLSVEDKIPVQTSQGSGVVDFPELIFQRQKFVYTKDFMSFGGREQVEGSASIVQLNDDLDYYKGLRTGEQSDSRARLSNPIRHGLFRLPLVNGRQSIDFTKRIQFIQHIGLNNWAEGSEITCSFGRRNGSDDDFEERMFGFAIKGAAPMLHLLSSDGQATPAEVQADNIPYGLNFSSTICMDFYPGEAFVLTLNGVEYELTDQLPIGVRANTTPGIWDVTNGANDEDIRFDIYRNEISVTS